MAASNRPLWQWSACELAEAIAARKLTAVDAVGSALDRMRATNGKINAVVDDLGEAALREAEAHDRAMSAGGTRARIPTEPHAARICGYSRSAVAR